ncbi:hypothetical protein PWA37_001390 [Arxiozyma heterogenica]
MYIFGPGSISTKD